jgi:hypothetical protein
MSLTDAKVRPRRVSKARSISADGAHWNDRQKIEAVTTYLVLGSIPLVSHTLKIPEATLWAWKATEWWKTCVADIKEEENLVLSAKIKKIVEKSWDVVGDRIEKGDWIYNQKTGEMIRKPVSLKDASKVAIDSANLREKLNMPDNYTVQTDQIEEKLSKLAQAFQDLAKGIKPKEPVEDIEFVEVLDRGGLLDNAISEEREEGLQNRE